jgi:hypothetical protein
VGFGAERKEMLVDVILIVVIMFIGGVLGLFVESLKYFYPIYLALLLFLAAELLTLLGRMLTTPARQDV